jgi:ribosomal protein S18 acetylase RimI-like enzyme
VRAAYRATFLQADALSPESMRESSAQAHSERLDDPPYDAFVALVDDQPAGRCTLYQVGDIARVMDLRVLPSFAERKVDVALMAHVLAMAKRLTMRSIVTQLEDDDTQGFEWYQQMGFARDGEIVEFERLES